MAPHVYYINLDRAADRRAGMEERLGLLAAEGVEHTRVSAVDGSKLKPEDLKVYDHDIARRKFGLGSNRMTPNEIACTLSHARVLQAILDAGHDYAVVLEDDVQLSPAFGAAIKAAGEIKTGYDLIYLNQHVRRRHRRIETIKTTAGPSDIVRMYYTQPCSYSYLVSRKGARKLLDHMFPIIAQYDVFLQRYWETRLEMFTLNPPVARVDLAAHTKSTIGDRPDTRHESGTLVDTARRKFRRGLDSFHKRMFVWLRYGVVTEAPLRSEATLRTAAAD